MAKQISFNLDKGRHGGRRKNSGRRKLNSKGVAHRTREKVTRHTPVHVNFKLNGWIRTKTCLKVLKRAIVKARRHGMNVTNYSLQSNHVHLIIEAASNEILTRGMRSLAITFAKGIKKIQIERYHLHVLKTLREVKNAIEYVLFNKQKHQAGGSLDEFTSDISSKLIKAFCIRNKMTLRMESRGEVLPSPTSYLLITSLTV